MIEETMRKIGISDFLKKSQEYELSNVEEDFIKHLDSTAKMFKGKK